MTPENRTDEAEEQAPESEHSISLGTKIQRVERLKRETLLCIKEIALVKSVSTRVHAVCKLPEE